ncbi:MAG TPA: hypothetical protein VMB81_32240 [Candidatus Sulfotelmatobacter sp.]|nr:hypothetical protein [Candidatus Sulfotelmatobacter sp.]
MVDMVKLSLLPVRPHAVPVRSSTIHDARVEPHEVPDACAYLFEVCRDLQRQHLDRCHADLLFDVEPGQLPQTICQALASMVRRFTLELTRAVPAPPPNGVVGVALRRRGTSWAVVLCDRGLRRYDQARQLEFEPAAALAARLNGTCEIRARGIARAITVTVGISNEGRCATPTIARSTSGLH